MTDPHTHDYWLTASGALECACGSSRRTKEQTMTELTLAQALRIAAFGFDMPAEEPDDDGH